MKPAVNVVAIALLTFGATAAQAAPWQVESYTINPGTFHTASQSDAAEDYYLTVSCHEETGVFEVYLESPFEWELDASYAPEVPAVLTIDGFAVTDVMFYFDDRSWSEGIRADNSTEAFTQLLERLLDATGEIEMSYFDRSATFSSEGIEDALYSLVGSCL